jgi:hypothetical protein
MEPDERVCPFCGEPPGPAMFCAACGRSLAGVDRLPTRAEWEAEADAAAAATDDRPVADRVAQATAAFLAAMEAAGRPGVQQLPTPSRSMLRRAPRVSGWVVRPVDRNDDVTPRRYAPGLLLGVDGAYHQLDSELRGFGQRDFPQYHHTVGAEPLPDPPAGERLPRELAAVLREHGLEAG